MSAFPTTNRFTLVDALSLADLRVFLQRASRLDDGVVRLVGGESVLAVYVAVLYPAGLLDSSPTVLGLRTFETVPQHPIDGSASLDVVVGLAALTGRVTALLDESTDATAPVEVTIPADSRPASWAAISPPRGGWTPLGTADAATLDSAARAGIDEVAATIPTGTGEQIVHRVRSEVWGRPIVGIEHVPAGGAFAAVSLGFLGGDLTAAESTVTVHETGTWMRLSSSRGHVLIKRRSASLVA